MANLEDKVLLLSYNDNDQSMNVIVELHMYSQFESECSFISKIEGPFL